MTRPRILVFLYRPAPTQRQTVSLQDVRERTEGSGHDGRTPLTGRGTWTLQADAVPRIRRENQVGPNVQAPWVRTSGRRARASVTPSTTETPSSRSTRSRVPTASGRTSRCPGGHRGQTNRTRSRPARRHCGGLSPGTTGPSGRIPTGPGSRSRGNAVARSAGGAGRGRRGYPSGGANSTSVSSRSSMQ